MKCTLLIPTRNEIDGMRIIMPQIKKEWVDEIIIIDGHSTDGTYEYALKTGYRTIKQKSNTLLGAYIEAVEAASGDVIIPFSPDGNSVPERIPELVAKIKEGYDLVICSRYMGGAKSEDDDPVTSFGNWMFTRLINLFFGAHYTDSLVMYRAWKKELLNLCTADAAWGGFEPQLAIKCAKYKLKVAEIPGDEPKRIGGIRKMDPLKNGSGVLYLIIKEALFREKTPELVLQRK